jgi:hypothetical protein
VNATEMKKRALKTATGTHLALRSGLNKFDQMLFTLLRH